MQIYPNKLQADVQQSLASVYLVFGDEPQQKMASLDAIRQRAKAEGFDERSVLVQDSDFQWQQFYEASQSLSLFSARQLIELELPTGKPGKEGGTALVEFAAQNSPDTLLVVHGPRIGKDVQRAKWFSALDKIGKYVPCYPLEGRQLTQWIQQQAQQAGLTITTTAAALLTEYCEGNMLAGAQEIEKLALIYPQQSIDEQAIEAAVVNQSRYTVFQLIDKLLLGDPKQTVKLLLALESEGIEPNIVIWALLREWQLLTQLKHTQGQINWQSHRIWGARQGYYQQALQRLTTDNLNAIGGVLARADNAFKQQTIFRPYVALSHLCLLFVNPNMISIDWDE